MRVAIHITHEALYKIGGIGSVINGLCTSENYKSFFTNTLLYGPLFSSTRDASTRLGKGGEVLYSSSDNYDKNNYTSVFGNIVKKYNIELVYGKREIVGEFNALKRNIVDVILIGITRINENLTNKFKFKLWERFGLQSDRFSDWDYEQYMRIAVPYVDILYALYPVGYIFYHFAHEYMGVPSALAAITDERNYNNSKTIFYAHEVSPCRGKVEGLPGHDISFYNTMREERSKGLFFEDVYGSQQNNYRAELVKRTSEFNTVFAVSDLIKDEYLFFVKGADEKRVKVVYNGIPLLHISHADKLRSRRMLKEYISNLFNFVPDIIFTHVARLIVSKGIWRDITFLYYIDELFHRNGLKGAYILLSSLVGQGRSPEDIYRMEEEYGWPVIHREGWPDLIGSEIDIYHYLSIFNAKSKSIKALFLNQFGFSRRRCGMRIPVDAEFKDLRIASDGEFGFSIYEPFGIAQLEVIPFGGISALSSSCGSSNLLRKSMADCNHKLYHVFDFINEANTFIRKDLNTSNDSIKNIDTDQRFKLEKLVFKNNAESFFKSLPKDGDEIAGSLRYERMKLGQEKAEVLGWERIVENIGFGNI